MLAASALSGFPFHTILAVGRKNCGISWARQIPLMHVDLTTARRVGSSYAS